MVRCVLCVLWRTVVTSGLCVVQWGGLAVQVKMVLWETRPLRRNAESLSPFCSMPLFQRSLKEGALRPQGLGAAANPSPRAARCRWSGWR